MGSAKGSARRGSIRGYVVRRREKGKNLETPTHTPPLRPSSPPSRDSSTPPTPPTRPASSPPARTPPPHNNFPSDCPPAQTSFREKRTASQSRSSRRTRAKGWRSTRSEARREGGGERESGSGIGGPEGGRKSGVEVSRGSRRALGGERGARGSWSATGSQRTFPPKSKSRTGRGQRRTIAEEGFGESGGAGERLGRASTAAAGEEGASGTCAACASAILLRLRRTVLRSSTTPSPAGTRGFRASRTSAAARMSAAGSTNLRSCR